MARGHLGELGIESSEVTAGLRRDATKEMPLENAPVPRTMIVPCLLLAGMTMLIGTGAQALFSVAEATASQLLDPSEYITAVLNGA